MASVTTSITGKSARRGSASGIIKNFVESASRDLFVDRFLQSLKEFPAEIFLFEENAVEVVLSCKFDGTPHMSDETRARWIKRLSISGDIKMKVTKLVSNYEFQQTALNPGDGIEAHQFGRTVRCIVGFFLDQTDSDNVYAVTTGHRLTDTESIYLTGNGLVGRIVKRVNQHNHDVNPTDFALVRLEPRRANEAWNRVRFNDEGATLELNADVTVDRLELVNLQNVIKFRDPTTVQVLRGVVKHIGVHTTNGDITDCIPILPADDGVPKFSGPGESGTLVTTTPVASNVDGRSAAAVAAVSGRVTAVGLVMGTLLVPTTDGVTRTFTIVEPADRILTTIRQDPAYASIKIRT